jgi:hypothetical protein
VKGKRKGEAIQQDKTIILHCYHDHTIRIWDTWMLPGMRDEGRNHLVEFINLSSKYKQKNSFIVAHKAVSVFSHSEINVHTCNGGIDCPQVNCLYKHTLKGQLSFLFV